MDAALAQHSTRPVALALRGSIPGKALALIPYDVGWMPPLAVAILPLHGSKLLKTPHAEPLLCDPFRLTGPTPCKCLVELSSSEYTPAVVVSTTLQGLLCIGTRIQKGLVCITDYNMGVSCTLV